MNENNDIDDDDDEQGRNYALLGQRQPSGFLVTEEQEFFWVDCRIWPMKEELLRMIAALAVG